MNHLISVGGGLASTWKLPERIIGQYGRENVHLVMAKLPNEDPDVWRLCDAVEARLGVSITYIGLNETPWDVFFRERMMGSSRIDPCSRVLKRQVIDKWMASNFDPSDSIRYVGFTHGEAHRMVDLKAIMNKKGWRVEAPLLHDRSLTRDHLMAECRATFGFVPRLYEYGFSHNNCGGACVKAGHKEWARLLRFLPDVYDWWESNEARFQAEVGTDATILRDRRGGTKAWLSLRAYRARLEVKWQEMLPGMDPFEGLDDTPACAYCGAT